MTKHYNFTEFQKLRKDAERKIRKNDNPKYQMVRVMEAARYLHNTTRREVELAIAYAVRVELMVSPEKVHPDDAAAAFRCIGSNGKYNMPIYQYID